ncbi:uncharacterized protein LOC134233530 [Saccostrea cucullata]|uniref:uncharacterized protein LOC134233530 n=1 Tax=Saccostrea cuccullata TaxID=36930 RepID=UPI002ED69B28
MSSQSRGSALHYVECATCKSYSRFYCNSCHKRMCEECRDTHLREKENRKHEIVLYQNRIKELPEEKCQIHTKKVLELYCTDCPAPVCSKCFASDHNGHQVLDLETVYNESLQEYQKDIMRIQETILPQSVENMKLQRQKVDDVKKNIEKMRLSMKKSADEIKAVVDVVLTENNAKLDIIEKSILDEMVDQGRKSDEFISFLEKSIKDYETKLASSKPTEIIELSKLLSTNSSIKYPAVSESVLPEFTKGTVIKKEIEKQFGEFSQRKEKVLKDEEDISLQISKKLSVNKAIHSNIPLAIEMKKIHLTSVKEIYHLSFFKFGIFWASDNNGNLNKFNMDGTTIMTIGSGFPNPMGYHAVNQKGDLIFTDVNFNIVYKLSNNAMAVNIINTLDWEPMGICFSHKHGDIHLGLLKGNEVKLESYRKAIVYNGLRYIKYASNILNFCGHVTYITENINGDVCISDSDKNQVLAVEKSGLIRFSYNGHHSQSAFLPYGICTDIMGHILVCNDHRDSLKEILVSTSWTKTVHSCFCYLHLNNVHFILVLFVLTIIRISWLGVIRDL